MSLPGEKINLMVMRDNGEVRSLRMRRALLVWLVVCCCITPLLGVGALWFALDMWGQNTRLSEQTQRLEQEMLSARSKAERLGNLEQLLQRNATVENAVVVNVNRPNEGSGASGGNGARGGSAPLSTSEDDEKAAAMQEGPGHNEFPTINTGAITVDNINVRFMPGNKLRVSLDLRNPDTRKVISGAVSCTLNTEAGESIPLAFKPNDAGDFRIARLKRAVLLIPLSPQTNATNGQVIVEVRSDAGEVAYRNVFPVER